MLPNDLNHWLAENTIWQNDLDGYHNETSLAPRSISSSQLATARILMREMGISFKSIPWESSQGGRNAASE